MLKWFHALTPKEGKVLEHVEAHSPPLVAGAVALRKPLDGGEQVPVFCAEAPRHESEADALIFGALGGAIVWNLGA